MSKKDLDLGQKLRLRTILFLRGYWSPIEVELSQYENGAGALTRASLTDLDVLGVRYDQLFTAHRIVGDCKAGRHVSDANRLFWLKGVMSYFGADQAYFLRPVISSHVRAMSPKLGVRVVSDAELTALEQALGADKIKIPVGDQTIYEEMDGLWGIDVPDGHKPTQDQLKFKQVYSLLSYTYWFHDPRRNLLYLLDAFESIADLLDPADRTHVLLVFTGAERFAHCLLEAAAFIQSQGLGEIARYARIYVHGGAMELRDKERFFELLRQLTAGQEQLDPPWLRDVTELLARLMRNPSGAYDILRHLTVMYIWCAHLEHHTLPPINGGSANTAAIVLAKDVIKTFVRATGMPEAMFESVRDL
jgi:hypothetical protein